MLTYVHMRLILKALKVIAVTWIALAVTASGASGVVLCFGADGHFALEMEHQGHCHDAEEGHGHGPQTTDQTLASAAADCCESCVDVSLSSDTMSQAVTKEKRSLTASDHLARAFSTVSAEAISAPEIDRSPPRVLMSAAMRASPALLVQRTIVLRI